MEAAKLLKKCGYRRRHNDGNCVIYELKEKQEYGDMPETFLIRKGNYSVEFFTDYIEKHIHHGTFSFEIDKALLEAINQQIEELKLEK